MIYVDPRAGSKDLIAPLKAKGLPVEVSTLEYGDVAFVGRGEQGAQVSVGIEYKHLEELVGSMMTQRLQGWQLPGMCATYEFRYLFIEGTLFYHKDTGRLLKRTRRGVMEDMPGQLTVNELLKRVYVLHLRGGMNIWWTQNRGQTVQAIMALYQTWTDKDLDEHTSHIGIYVPPSFAVPTPEQRTLFTFPGLGKRASLAALKTFGTIERAVNATEDEWAQMTIQGARKSRSKRLGPATARRIKSFLQGKGE